MAEGSNTYMDMAAPLYPKDGVEIKQQGASSAVDILTLTAAASGTGDFIVTQTSTGTEKFVVEDGGNILVTGAAGDVLHPGAGEPPLGVLLPRRGDNA